MKESEKCLQSWPACICEFESQEKMGRNTGPGGRSSFAFDAGGRRESEDTFEGQGTSLEKPKEEILDVNWRKFPTIHLVSLFKAPNSEKKRGYKEESEYEEKPKSNSEDTKASSSKDQ
ncbi:hypothetical protein HWI79_3360 [Cryptosporidium felis]|nr:hypothetical protein HWI79_3360 [Cryptosporidium felis]